MKHKHDKVQNFDCINYRYEYMFSFRMMNVDELFQIKSLLENLF